VFDLTESGLTYKTAGNLGIYPENSEPVVNKFAEVAGLNLEERFHIVANKRFTGKGRQMPLPAANFYTVRDLLTKFLDLTGPLT
jgi:sulfite reductase alpha subunit-like flavoprotein